MHTVDPIALAQALKRCDSEPIHFTGSVQSHGALLAVDDTAIVRAHSANIGDLWGHRDGPILGLPVTAVLGQAAWDKVLALGALLPEQPPVPLLLPGPNPADNCMRQALVHRSAALRVVEMEGEPCDSQSREDQAAQAFSALNLLLAPTPDANAYVQTLAQQVQLLTGFERVMVYRLDDQWNGQVIAERCAQSAPAFLGQQFPACDIPETARRLYAKNWVSLLCDRDAPASALVHNPADAEAALDLSFSVLRSVAETHLQCLRHLDVAACISVSLMQHDTLWGLVICHNRLPTRVPLRLRHTLELIARSAAIRLPALAFDANLPFQQRLDEATQALLQRPSAQSPVSGLPAALVYDNSSEAMVVTTANGTVIAINPAFSRITGYSEEEMLGQSLHLLKSGRQSEDFYRKLWRDLNSTGHWRGELWNRKKNGEVYAEFLTINTIYDASGEPWRRVGLMSEMTAQKLAGDAAAQHQGELEQLVQSRTLELEKARDQAQAASVAKSQFLANMSHEIRTPMNAILGLLKLLQTTDLNARQRDYANKTEGAARSLLGLLNDILDFSKVEAGKMTLEREPFQLQALLGKLSVLLGANVGHKNVEVLYDLDPELPEQLLGDAMRLQQILLNLGGNAVKFTAVGQVVLSLRRVAATHSTVRIAFAVQDSGIGIAPEHRAHIFDGFSQAEGSTTRRYGGTGLGLVISQHLVEQMGGSIAIESCVGKGSTFSFELTFPMVPPMGAASAAAWLPAQRALVVEDNPISKALLLRMIRSWGWSADAASDGESAIALIAQQQDSGAFPYTVVYLDWQLPKMDGWEAAARIRALARARGQAQPLVFMVTAHAQHTLAQRSAQEQALLNGFLAKPVTPSMLQESLKQARAKPMDTDPLTQLPAHRRRLIGMRLLVVEDNLINQQVAKELLAAEGARVTLAANGRLGVAAVRDATAPFDAVLMDLQMPELDGYAATKAIREELGLRDLPIIAMTANAMASDRAACLAAGMNAHIGKPFDMAELLSLLLQTTGFQIRDTRARPQAAAPSTALPDIHGLDWAPAIARMSGMRRLYASSAGELMLSLGLVQPDMRPLLDAGDRVAAARYMHTLKSNAATLGATELSARAAELEHLCRTNGTPHACAQGLEDLGDLLASTQALLQRAIAHLER